MEFLFSAESWAALLTLTVLEIVLGIDNIIFISILAGKLHAGLGAGHGHADSAAPVADLDHAADAAPV
jgi:hypothetical protein